MQDKIALIGVVATQPKMTEGNDGFIATNFRIASNQRRYEKGQWVDLPTNFYGVSAYGDLGKNVSASISKGEHVVISGKLRVSEWRNGDRSGTNVDVIAEAVGHDLRFGTTALSRRAFAVDIQQNDDESSTRDEVSRDADRVDDLEGETTSGGAPDPFPSDSELVSAGTDGESTPF